MEWITVKIPAVMPMSLRKYVEVGFFRFNKIFTEPIISAV